MPSQRIAAWLLSFEFPEKFGPGVNQAVEAAFREDDFPATSLSRIADDDHAPWRFEIWFDKKPDIKKVENILTPVFTLEGLDLPTIALHAVEPRDWVRLSQEGLDPVRAGRFFVYGAHSGLPPVGVLPIHIEAGEAFGTGHHASTSGCLTLMSALGKYKAPQSALDFGCGAGVLAIAAAKLWHIHVIACDIDPIAVRVTRENARSNGVAPFIHAQKASSPLHLSKDRAPLFDLILANILAKPLKQLAGSLSARLAPQGTLILSGLLASQAHDVGFAYKTRGLKLVQSLTSEGWSSLQFQRP